MKEQQQLDSVLERNRSAHPDEPASRRQMKDVAELDADVSKIQRAIDELPPVPFPDQALRRVWAETVRATRVRRRTVSLGFARWLATAAAIAVTVMCTLMLRPRREPEISPQELTAIARETRMVFQLTNAALIHVRQTAMDEVLATNLTPALRRIGVQLLHDVTRITNPERSTGT